MLTSRLLIGTTFFHPRLHEDLSICPLVLLALNLNRLVPCPHAVDKLLVGLVLGVELLE